MPWQSFLISVKPCACDLSHLDAILEKINKLEVFSSEVRQWISLFTKSDSATGLKSSAHVSQGQRASHKNNGSQVRGGLNQPMAGLARL